MRSLPDITATLPSETLARLRGKITAHRLDERGRMERAAAMTKDGVELLRAESARQQRAIVETWWPHRAQLSTSRELAEIAGARKSLPKSGDVIGKLALAVIRHFSNHANGVA